MFITPWQRPTACHCAIRRVGGRLIESMGARCGAAPLHQLID
jgi:hypothetical protein